MCPHMHIRNSSNVTLILIDLNSKIMLDAKNSSSIVLYYSRSIQQRTVNPEG